MNKAIYTLLLAFSINYCFAQNECAGEMTYYDLPELITTPDKVVNLDIAMNKLTSISPEIAKLKNLRCLDLSFNRIGTLPDEFKQLTKLEYLNLAGTRYMAKLPEVLKEMPNLKTLNISDHPEWAPGAFEDAKKMLPNVNVITK